MQRDVSSADDNTYVDANNVSLCRLSVRLETCARTSHSTPGMFRVGYRVELPHETGSPVAPATAPPPPTTNRRIDPPNLTFSPPFEFCFPSEP